MSKKKATSILAAMMGWMDPSLMHGMGFRGAVEAVDNVPPKARARWEEDKAQVQPVIDAILTYKKKHNLNTSKMARLLEIKPSQLKSALACGKIDLYLAAKVKVLIDVERAKESGCPVITAVQENPNENM